jgi:hypothetical protein
MYLLESMVLVTLASAQKGCQAKWDSVRSKVDERRTLLENARNMNVKRLQTDVNRIAKRELEYTKKLVEELVPVRITWNEEAWERVQSFIPVRIEPIEKEETKEANDEI